MSRVLLLGTGPLPGGDLTVMDFPRLRTWQFLRALLQGGHQVYLVATGPGSRGGWHEVQFEGHPLHLLPVPFTDFDRPDLPARWLMEAAPTAVVSAGPFGPARAAAFMPPGVPVWIDVPGDPLAEAQLRASSTGDVRHLAHARRVHSLSLARGDAFSVISDRQRLALLGQLALEGRFTVQRTERQASSPGARSPLVQPLVQRLPVAVEPAWERWARASRAQKRKDRVVWPGAINTWADGRTFFEACELAMSRHPTLEVVVTGGPIQGHEEAAWYRLRELVAGSPFASRWRLTGWVDPVQAAREVLAAKVGVSLDLPCLEAMLGSRTRLLYGISLGLSWITTPGAELADQLIGAGLATGVAFGDARGVAQAILDRLAVDTEPEELRRARAQVLAAYDGKALAVPLLRWLERPHCVPEAAELGDELSRRLAEAERELAAVQHSLTWRVLGALQRRLHWPGLG